jgi:excisionase family DNA binding protein
MTWWRLVEEQAFPNQKSLLLTKRETFSMATELVDNQKDFVSPDELASVLNITPTFVGDLIREKKITYYRLGWRCVRIRLSEVLERTRIPAQKPMAPIPKKFKPQHLKHLKHVMAAEKKETSPQEEAALPTQNATSAT